MQSPRHTLEVQRSPANRPGRQNIEVAREEAEVGPRTPIVIPAFIRTLYHWFWIVIMWIAPFPVVYGVVWFFFGETTVTATLDDKPVTGYVWIDGQFVGDTPYTTRLGFGRLDIIVYPPGDSDTNESEFETTMWSFVLGMDVPADFTSVDDK